MSLSLRDRVYAVMGEDAPPSPGTVGVRLFLLIVIVVSVSAVTFETVGPLAAVYGRVFMAVETIALLVFAVCLVLMILVVRSPFGLALRGIRENEARMRSLGFNTWLHCYLSFVIAGAFASVAGVMWAYYNGFVSPTYLDLTASSELFLMVTLGGPATLVGPMLGAGAIVLLKNVMSAYTARWLLILGIVYIVAILAAPQGIWNLGSRRSS